MSTFPGDWQYKRQISIDSGQKSGSPSKIVLVITHDAIGDENGPLDADGTAPAQNGGGDLRASTDEAGTSQIALDVVDFVTDNDHASAVCELHVQFDDLSSDSFWLHWGTSETDTQPVASDTYGQYAVYDANEQVHYSMNEDPTGTVYNRTSASYDLISVGTMTSGDSVAGKIGNAIDFDGVDDYLKTSVNVSGFSTVTVSAWVYSHDVAKTSMICGSESGASSRHRCLFYHDSSGYVRILVGDGSTAYSSTADGTTLTVNTWHHVTLVADGSNLRRYLDGSATGTVDAAANGLLDTGNDALWVAARNSNNIPTAGQFFNGLIDRVLVYDRAMSADDIATIHNCDSDNATFWSVGAVQGVAANGNDTAARRAKYLRP